MNANIKSGLLVALAALVADQASKLYLLFVYDIATRGAVKITPFFDLVLTWNRGISYGWFQAETAPAQALLLAIKVAAVAALAVWLWHAHNRITALGLGLIIGGAIGNGIDSVAYGAVVDFAFFHVQLGDRRFDWYVFNLADVAIVAGVIGLLYDSLLGGSQAAGVHQPQKRRDLSE
jgi:signal peptidase II